MKIDIEKYLMEHLPYSIEIMLSHEVYLEKYHEKVIDDNQILRGVFVGSITKGRMLLEVIGIKLAKTGQIQDSPKIVKDSEGEDSDETPVNSESLGGKLANVAHLKETFPEELEKLRHYLIAANKYELHLTKQRHERDLELYNQAIPIILSLVDTHIYKTNLTNLKIRQDLIETNRTFRDALNRATFSALT